TDQVRQAVRQVVGAGFLSPVAPFVIARDVATEMADPLTRHAVLIEVKETSDRATLRTQADALERELRNLERDFKAELTEGEQNQDYFHIDRLRRYVGATL